MSSACENYKGDFAGYPREIAEKGNSVTDKLDQRVYHVIPVCAAVAVFSYGLTTCDVVVEELLHWDWPYCLKLTCRCLDDGVSGSAGIVTSVTFEAARQRLDLTADDVACQFTPFCGSWLGNEFIGRDVVSNQIVNNANIACGQC